MTTLAARTAASIWAALGGNPGAAAPLEVRGDGALPSAFAVTDLAAASIAAAGLAIAEWLSARGRATPAVSVDRRLASFWFGMSLRPSGWTLPSPWDPIAGDYRGHDGWIRLHTNAPHHRAAAQRVLGPHDDKTAMGAAVTQWAIEDLEAAIVAEGGCAAQMRSITEWAAHPQGRAVAAEPLVQTEITTRGADADWRGVAPRPLAGVRVLDLTRVLAGPVASRFLAGFGAQVLRIDPPHWNEPGVVPEVTLGKRCARLDLTQAGDRARFEALLRDADVLLHGYRANALERLGFGAAVRSQISPGLVDVSLNAYGWSGPWRDRRGFDSLVQMSAGIADAGMRWKHAAAPVPLPVQALDHATGYLMAAAAVRALTRRLTSGFGSTAQLALARTATLLVALGDQHTSSALASASAADLDATVEHTPWGDARRVSVPVSVAGAPMRWELPACELGSSPPSWH
jgi:hypothetical protein